MRRKSKYDPEIIMSKIEREKRRRESAIKYYERQKAYKEKLQKENQENPTKNNETLA